MALRQVPAAPFTRNSSTCWCSSLSVIAVAIVTCADMSALRSDCDRRVEDARLRFEDQLALETSTWTKRVTDLQDQLSALQSLFSSSKHEWEMECDRLRARAADEKEAAAQARKRDQQLWDSQRLSLNRERDDAVEAGRAELLQAQHTWEQERQDLEAAHSSQLDGLRAELDAVRAALSRLVLGPLLTLCCGSTLVCAAARPLGGAVGRVCQCKA